MARELTETAAEVPAVTENTLPAPIFDGAAMGQAITRYRDLQGALDKAMPDAIMLIKGKPFRKKAYWRAVAKAFRLQIECVGEERIRMDSDWGFTATYRATAPSGDHADGDGACMASEKVDRDGNPTAMQTIHNVRAHAHTRAMNRAISNLCGFGEVSAEEADSGNGGGAPQRTTSSRKRAGTITEKQVKRLYARIKEAGLEVDRVKAWCAKQGVGHFSDLSRPQYDHIDNNLEKWAQESDSAPIEGEVVEDIRGRARDDDDVPF